MAVKRKTEHRAKNIKISRDIPWADVLKRIEAMCDEMHADGWTLLTMGWPNLTNAVLVFTRPGE